MAESYRGLTIRIGGDTTKLTQALKAANGAASQTQAELRKVGQALKLDPGNMNAYNIQLQQISNQAQNTAMKLAQLRSSSEQLANKMVRIGPDEEDITSLKELSDETENASLRLSQARVNVSQLSHELGSMHNKVSELAKEASEVEKAKLAEAFNLAAGVKSVDEIRESFAKMPDGTERTKEQIDAIINSVEDLAKRLSGAVNVDTGEIDVDNLREAIDYFNKLSNGASISREAVKDLVKGLKEIGEIDEADFEVANDVEELRRKRDEAAKAEEANQESLRQKIRSTYDEAKSQVDALAAKNEEENERIAQSEEELASRLRSIDRNESDNRYDEQVEALSKVETAADRAKDALRQLHEGEREFSTDDPLGVADNDYVNGIKQQYEDARKTEQAFFDESIEMSKKSHEAFKAGLEANKAGNKELYEQMSAESEKYFSRERELWASYQEAGRESHRLLGQEAVASYQVILDKATQVREAMVKVWAGSDRTYRDEATDDNAEGAIKSEISAARNLLDSYRNYYKDVLRGLRRDLNQAQKDGENDLAARLKSEIEGYGQVRDTIVGMLKSHISKLTTELEGISDVRDVYLKEDADYSGRSTIQLYEDINSKIKDTQSLRDSEQQKIAATRAEMEAAGKSQEEIASATADSVAEVERLDAKIKEMKADLATVAGGRGQYLKDAMGEALSERATEIADRERVTGEVAQKYEDQRAQAQREHDAEREAAQKRIEANEREIASITSKAEEEMSTMASEMVESMDRAKQSADDLTSRIEQSEGVETFADKVRDAFAGLGDSLGDVVAEKFNFDMGNVDVDNLKKTLESIAPDIGLDPSKIAAFVQEAERLKTAFAEADDEVKRAKLVAEFQDLLIEIEKGESSLTNFSRVLSDMKTPSDLVRGLYEINGSLSAMDEAYKGLMQMGSSLDSIFKADPKNTQALTLAMQAYSAAQQVAIQNASTLEEKMSRFNTGRIAAGTDSTKSADQQLLEASKAAEEAERSYDELKGKISATEATIARLGNTASKTASDIDGQNEEAAKSDDERNKELQLQYQLRLGYNALLDEAAQRKSDTSEALQIAKERKELEDATAQAVQYADAIRKSTEAWAEASKQEAVLNVVGDTSSIDDLGKQLEAAANRAKALKEAVKLDPKNAELLAAKEQAVADVSELVKRRTEEIRNVIANIPTDKVDALREKYGTVSNAVKVTTDATKRYGIELNTAKEKLSNLVKGAKFDAIRDDVLDVGKELDKSVIDKLGDSADAVIKLRNTIAVLGPAFSEAAEDMDFAAVIAKNEDLLKKLGDTVKLGDLSGNNKVDDAAVTQIFSRISQYAERVGRKIIESADTIDAAYRDMRKTVQGTEEEFQRLHDEAVKFSQTSIVSADQMLEMEALGGQLGIATESLQSFGENASNLLIATDFDDAEELALKLGQLTNVMGDLDESTFENFADALVRLGNNTATTESGIMNVAQRMSSVANVTSMTTPQLLAWSAAIASTGQRSEAAATAVTKTITGIGQAVAGGGDTLVQFAQIAGMTADEFKEAWANSSSEALEAFVKGLETLSDDSTDAIEALDSVGITSVRQETALLGLSQTIENLDASIKMSQDAFDGVSDQWGDAGDAAREAQRKSEGFSGSLQILKNNAANLAASLGESLVGPMNLVSAALRMLTDLFTGLPKPIQSATVLLGGIAVAVGPVANAVKQLKKAWEEMTAAMAASKGVEAATSTSSGDMAKLMSSLKGLIPAFKDARAEGQTFTQAIKTAIGGLTSAEGAAGALGSMLSSGLFAVGIGAAIAVVSVLVTEIASAIDRTNRLNEAKQDLAKATDKLSDSARGAVNAEKEVANSIYDVRKGAEDTITKIEEMARKQEQLADSIKGRNTDYKAQAEMVNEAREAISKYMNVSNLSNEAQGDLMSAVHMLNSELGTTYEVVDSVNGIVRQQGSDVNETRESFEKYVDSQLRAAKAEGVLESIKETERALIAAESELTESKEKMNALTEESSKKLVYNKSVLNEVASGTNLNSAEMNDLSKTMESQQSTVDSYRQTLNELKEEYRSLAGSAADSSQQEQDAIAKMAYGMSEFKGVLSNMSEADDFARQIQSLGATSESFGALTHEQLIVIAQAYDHSVGSIEAALSRLGISFENALSGTAAAANTLKTLAEGATASLTPATTEEVNKQKKLDTAAYNARKKTLDQEYKDKQKAYDADYKARQKELDKIYKAEQKASQNYLKQFKERQSEEVEAFKEATDAKLKEIEREYEAKKELLELEYEKYDKDIDDRIQAIKDEQDAEDEAVKQRERREKLEELGKAVETAKTKKKREEAEKALSDYKDQLAREDTKKQRDAQIQALQDQKTALKEQLSERQEELKKSYDEAVSSYKAAREEELKILQKQHEIAYESENEFQTERLESIKEAHSAELESMKETQQAELELIKERNDQELSDMKEKQEEYIEAMKNGTAKAMANINNALEETASKIPQVGELIKAGLVNISEDGVISFTDEFKKMPGVTDEVMQLITDKIREAIPDVEITAEGIAKAVEKPTKDAANQIEQSVTGSFQKIADAMRKSKDIDLPTYLNAINGLPTAIEEVFNKSGLSVQNGLDEVARRMLESGKISLSQYLDIMNGMPGSTRAICNETGIAIAEELGLFNEQTGTAASNLKKSVTSQFESMPREVKGKSDEAGNAVSSLGGQDAVDSAAKNSGSLYEAVMGRWSNVGTDGKNVGMQFPLSMASGASSRADSPIKAVASIAESVIKTVESGNKGMKTSGWNQIINYANGMTKAGTEAVKAAMTIAGNIASYFHHSTPDKGPLRDDDKWGGEMVQNFIDSMMLMAPRLESEASSVAGAVESGFTPTMGSDVIGQLIESMRSQESRLLEQSRRMADIVERGFDPKLTVDAAYEAIGKIDAGEMRKQKLIAGSQSVDNSTYAPVLNFTINATVREEADIDRLSQQIAIRVQRSINARIG